MSDIPKMLTIRQVAATGILPEYAIRQLVKEGKLAGVYVGNKYLVNFTALLEQLSQPDKGGVANG